MDRPKANVVMHYASPYYDPVKAHEYYMDHRELKGRPSTAKLNDNGKIAASYIKKQVNDERDAKIKTHKDQTVQNITSQKYNTNSKIKENSEQLKRDIDRNAKDVAIKVEAHKDKMTSRISQLQSKLQHMTSRERAVNKARIQEEIASLRNEHLSFREELNTSKQEYNSERRTENVNANTELRTALSSYTTEQNEAHKEFANQVKEEYAAKYISELEGLLGDSSMLKSTKTKQSKQSKNKAVSAPVSKPAEYSRLNEFRKKLNAKYRV